MKKEKFDIMQIFVLSFGEISLVIGAIFISFVMLNEKIIANKIMEIFIGFALVLIGVMCRIVSKSINSSHKLFQTK